MKILAHIFLAMVLSSCADVVIRIDEIPANTPTGTDLFVCGNFNYWDPADEDYRLRRMEDSSWYCNIPAGRGEVKFWITRGEWSSIETDGCGNRIAERIFHTDTTETYISSVASWTDVEPLNCGLVTIVIDSLPEGTSEEDDIIVAGDFNGWDTEDTTYKAQRDESTGKLTVSIPRPMDRIEYRYIITRGDLRAAEANDLGGFKSPRALKFSKDDTVNVSVSHWEDELPAMDDVVTLILDEVPEYTPAYEDIYIASNLNGWFPRDKEWRMEMNSDGTYQLSLPRMSGPMNFKFTRGDWKSVEGDKKGNEIGNRQINLNEKREYRFKVASWKDIHRAPYNSIYLEVKVPENTPNDAKIFLTGDFNGWKAGREKYRLKMMNGSIYSYRIPVGYAGSSFKLTRGSWSKEECDSNGSPVRNRKLSPNSKGELRIEVENWMDMAWKENEGVVFILESLPRKNPEEGPFFMSTSLNNWQAASPEYQFQKNENDDWELFVPKPADKPQMEYKINRGSWESVESNRLGGEIYNHLYKFKLDDTVRVHVKGWKDL